MASNATFTISKQKANNDPKCMLTMYRADRKCLLDCGVDLFFSKHGKPMSVISVDSEGFGLDLTFYDHCFRAITSERRNEHPVSTS